MVSDKYRYVNVGNNGIDTVRRNKLPSGGSMVYWLGRRTCDRDVRVRLPAVPLPGSQGLLSLPSFRGR